jgi:hypothetical protein
MRNFRNFRVLFLSIAVLGLMISPLALADCEKHAEAAAGDTGKACCAKKAQQADAEMKDCCKQAGGRENCEECEYAAVAASAKSGCSKSAAKLIAMAKESGCPEGAALAAKAEQGDEEALSALIAGCSGSKQTQHAVTASHHTAETAMLAEHASNGCSKSTAQLVTMVKESGCPKGAALVAKVEAGDEDAKAELIAMFAAEDTGE